MRLAWPASGPGLAQMWRPSAQRLRLSCFRSFIQTAHCCSLTFPAGPHAHCMTRRAGMDVVFHCATAAPAAANTANRKLMHDVNVLGTRHLLDACAAAGVRHLVYTSSASVRGPGYFSLFQYGGPPACYQVQKTGPQQRT